MSEDKKKSRYSQSQNKATQKYIKNHLENIMVRVKKGEKDYFKAAAEQCGLSLNKFIVTAMIEKISRDGIKIDPVPAPEQEDQE